MRNYTQILNLFKLRIKSLVIGLIIPTLQHIVNSLWHAIIKRHILSVRKKVRTPFYLSFNFAPLHISSYAL